LQYSIVMRTDEPPLADAVMLQAPRRGVLASAHGMALWMRMILFSGLPGEVGPALERHREQLRRLRAAGRLRVAGEFARGDGTLEIFEAADRLEAESIAQGSALVEEGQASWILREWTDGGGAAG